jgi:hypothetical protein
LKKENFFLQFNKRFESFKAKDIWISLDYWRAFAFVSFYFLEEAQKAPEVVWLNVVINKSDIYIYLFILFYFILSFIMLDSLLF